MYFYFLLELLFPIIRHHCLTKFHEDLLQCSKTFIVLDHIFRYIIHCKLIIVYGLIKWYLIILSVYTPWSHSKLLKRLLFLLNSFSIFVEDPFVANVKVYFLNLNYILLFISFLMRSIICLGYCSFEVSIEIEKYWNLEVLKSRN